MLLLLVGVLLCCCFCVASNDDDAVILDVPVLVLLARLCHIPTQIFGADRAYCMVFPCKMLPNDLHVYFDHADSFELEL